MSGARAHGRDRLRWPVEEVVQEVNGYLRGWAGYFRYGNSTSSSTRSSTTRNAPGAAAWQTAIERSLAVRPEGSELPGPTATD